MYNVEPFIEEAIQSLIEQDFGFEQNVQLILVDDGSPDKSGEICDQYKELYPNNIVVIHKENGGVSSARNAGFPYVRGKYVNFMDSDDMLSKNTLKNVFVFFEEHYNDIELISIPIYLNKKILELNFNEKMYSNGSRVIDLNKESVYIMLNISRMFIKYASLKNIKFGDYSIIIQDGIEIQKLLLTNQKFGVVNNCRYILKNQPKDKTLLDSNSIFDKEYYFSSLVHFALPTLKNVQQQLGYVPKHIQYSIMYELKWKIKVPEIPIGVLTKDDESYFWQLLKETLQFIEDKIILEQKSIFIEHKLFLLNLKYGKFATVVSVNDDAILIHNNIFIRYLSVLYTRIDFIKYENQKLTFEGRAMCLNCDIDEKINIYAVVNDVEYLCEPIEINQSKYSLNQLIFRSVGFLIDIDIDDTIHDYKIKFMFEYRGHKIIRKDIRFGKFTPIAKELKSCYYYKDRRVLTFNQYIFTFKKCGRKGLIKHELNFLKSIKTKYKKEVYKIGLIRLYTRLRRKFNKKQIWLVSDRIHIADDNGSSFFQYLCKKHPKNVKVYFLIDKNSKDYSKMTKIGKVIDFHSQKKKFYFLQATNIISSSIDDYVLNPFKTTKYLYCDLLQFNFIFLQHGIIKDDLSKSINRYNRNIRLFVTSVSLEYNSILEYDYSYKEREVLLSGLPRYDLLYSNSQKIITIMPTWRKYLTTGVCFPNGKWDLIDDFEECKYYIFYNSLLNNEPLLSNAKRLGYKIVFFPHPNIMPHIDRFTKHAEVEFIRFDKPYREIFAESDLIVNDYSSASMDFSYLRKPVVYAHFDKENFFSGAHSYKPGYFSYEDNGFGEVEYTLEGTIARIIEYMENGCKLKDKYRARIDDFFAFNDKNNCQRVYDAILKLDED